MINPDVFFFNKKRFIKIRVNSSQIKEFYPENPIKLTSPFQNKESTMFRMRNF